MEFRKIILMVLALVVFIILAAAFFFPQKGLLPKATNATTSFGDVLDQAIGKSTTKSGGIIVESKHLEAIKKLKEKIIEMRDSSKQECFGYYKFGVGSDSGRNGLPELGEDGTTIEIFKRSDGMEIRVLKGEANALQEYSAEKVVEVTPCVIGGGVIPRNFHNKFLGSGSTTGSYFNEVDQIFIKYDVGEYLGIADENKNRISHGGKWIDFEDGGFLFKSGKHICFFPTEDDDACDGSSSEGLGAGCLGRGTAISSLISSKGLRC